MARFMTATGDGISMGSPSVLNTSSAVSMSLWFKLTSFTFYVGSFAFLAGRNVAAQQASYLMYVSTSGHVRYLIGTGTGGGTSFSDGSGTAVLNTWYNVILTWSTSAGLSGYLNGVSDITNQSNAINMVTDTETFKIGNDPANNNLFQGPVAIADVSVWSTVLSGTQITQIVNGVRPASVNAGNLIGWWPLDGFASPETDLSGNGNTGTLTGTSSVLGPPQLWRTFGN